MPSTIQPVASVAASAGECGDAGCASPQLDEPDARQARSRADGHTLAAVIDIEMAASTPGELDIDWLRAHVAEAARWLPCPIARVSVAIVDDARMIELHQRHLNVGTTTDVLTFHQSAQGEPIDADLAVGVDEAARRGAELGHRVERELLLYIVHGLLHCAGFDDHDEPAARAMHAEEDRILRAIGVGATYAADSPSERDVRP